MAYRFKQQCEITQKNFLHLLSISLIDDTSQCTEFTLNVKMEPNSVEFDHTIDDLKQEFYDENIIIKQEQNDIDTQNSQNNKISKKTETNAITNVIYYCDTCNWKFKHKFSLIKHFKLKHNMQKNVYPCSSCNKIFKRSLYLDRHIALHQDKNRNTCEICSKTFFNRANLSRHIKEIHNQERPFYCNYCSRSFTQLAPLKEHISVTHIRETNFVCDICDKRMMTRKLLIVHMNSIHRGIKKIVKKSNKSTATKTNTFESICQFCGKICRSKSHHIHHERMHTGVKPFVCDICDRRFIVKISLRQHYLTHTGERPYSCNMCDKKFRQSAHLRSHQKVIVNLYLSQNLTIVSSYIDCI